MKVTHTWQCLFVHLLAAICADALGLEEYQALAQQLIEDPQGLRESLEAKGGGAAEGSEMSTKGKRASHLVFYVAEVSRDRFSKG